MKKYQLTILNGDNNMLRNVFATSFSTTSNSGSSKGFYAFYDGTELVACYPIDRTIIETIENLD